MLVITYDANLLELSKQDVISATKSAQTFAGGTVFLSITGTCSPHLYFAAKVNYFVLDTVSGKVYFIKSCLESLRMQKEAVRETVQTL